MMWPISFDDVLAARNRIRPWLRPTRLMRHEGLEELLTPDAGIRLLVKHEHENPTGSFKVRNGLSAVTGLSRGDQLCGVVAASRGNHGLGLAWAGSRFDLDVTICVPVGNNPEKNDAIRMLGAKLIEEGADYDSSVHVMERLVEERGLTMVHSTNEPLVIAGAATLTLEALGQAEQMGEKVDAIVLAVGGGSQSVGALTVVRQIAPDIRVYGVQAAGASAIHDSWHAGEPRTTERADTFAGGLATRMSYDLTFGPLCEGLTDFITVTDAEIAAALRLFHERTGVAPEGAGAAGIAGVRKLGSALEGQTVLAVISGANISEETLARVLAGEI